MAVVAGAMTTLIAKLTTLLMDQYKLQRGARGDIMFIKEELESIQAALEKLFEVQVTDSQVKIWERDVREQSYDIEDIIDTFMVHVETHLLARPHGLLEGFVKGSLSRLKRARIRHSIATDIRRIRRLVNEATARRERYKVDSIVAAAKMETKIDPRLVGIYGEAAKLVGISGPKEELARLLMESEGTTKNKLKVISIVGVGGLGKTTLANVIYQQFRQQFDCHAFVSVSLKPDLKKILGSILRQFSQQGYNWTEAWGAEEIINQIRDEIKDKRYLIVIDDIWEKPAWECIECALIENDCESRIITTSRVLDAATPSSSEVDHTIYKLQPLSYDNSKKLFYKRIFCCEDGCPSELKDISEKTLRKCDGVPLAIITIGSLLATRPQNINQWDRVHNLIGSGLEKSHHVEDMRHILSISYYDLPADLRACFLYLTIYPEDYNIQRDQLIRRWISEGFILGENVDALYEQGGNYFSELINRSMIQPAYIDSHGRVHACRVHDMVLDLITSLSNETNFLTVLGGQQCTYYPNKVRRLCLQSSIYGYGHTIQQKKVKWPRLRSLILFPHATNLLPSLSRFRILRVLDLEGCQDLKCCQIEGICDLFHLRSLILKDTNISSLPPKIGNLSCLHTLDIRHTVITELPSTVVYLRKLVTLLIDASVKLPDGIGNMECLQEISLVGISKSPNFLKDLGSLTELRILQISESSGVWYKSYEKTLSDSLCSLHKIHDLYIHGCKLSAVFVSNIRCFPQHLRYFSCGQLSMLPRWINSSLLHLSTIDLILNILRQDDLQSLGALHFLHCLRLNVFKIEPERLVVGTGHAKFHNLAEFSFTTHALGLIFRQYSMPRLENLELAFNVQETMNFDIGLEHLSSLKAVTVRLDCRDSRIFEVQSADAAIRRIAYMNSNQPNVHVIRHYEHNMIKDDVKVQKETKEGKEILENKIGPWGGNGGVTCDIKVASKRLESVTICSGIIIDALAFSYFDKDGERHTTSLWGGLGGSVQLELKMKWKLFSCRLILMKESILWRLLEQWVHSMCHPRL
ncbi:disease resistance protein RGA5-like isoform X2 [Oryza brachyantha]|uniref:disease resistance protein RGA5-like isoform X2 n=1 Tax=Oryza brachyantha TaxID=4533 RepID=UPI0007766B1C|nr:disease resistance protein RGA5-like isoform X2 [Oryza brachyantha]